METTTMTLSQSDLIAMFEARRARFETLQARLLRAPLTNETKLQRRLVARALYSTWLDLEELKAAAAAN